MKTRTRKVAMMAVMSALALLAGCRQDMHDQPKFIPQRGTSFFADGRSVRPQVVNTVARGQLHEDSYYYTGMADGKEGTMMPFPVTSVVLERGQEKFNLYCTPCHSRVGNGQGMIVQRGYRPAGNFQTARLLNAPIGHFFTVMTHGFGAMPDYSAQLTESDRWAVAAYIRALQLSQNAKLSDVPAGEHVESLKNIAVQEGMPAGFAGQWEMPATAVTGTPNGEDNGIPAAVNLKTAPTAKPAKAASPQATN